MVVLAAQVVLVVVVASDVHLVVAVSQSEMVVVAELVVLVESVVPAVVVS